MQEIATNRKIEFISCVVPVFNEERGIGEFCRLLIDTLKVCCKGFEIILINDGSSDSTESKLFELSSIYPQITGLNLSRNFGKEAALFAGLEASRGDIVITIDGDNQHPVTLIPNMIDNYLCSDADIVEAKKISPSGRPFINSVIRALFFRISSYFSGFNLADHSDFKLLSRPVVNKLIGMNESVVFYRGLAHWIGFKRIEIPFEVTKRLHGQSKFSLSSFVTLGFRALFSYSSKPLLLIPLSAVIYGAFSFVLGARVLKRYLEVHIVEGIPTLIFVLLISTTFLLLCLTLVAIYLSQIFAEIKSRPKSIVRSIINRGQYFPGTRPTIER